MRIIIACAFILIISSLGSALFYLITDRGKRSRMVYALMLRVGFSIALFLFILFAYHYGWIESTGLPIKANTRQHISLTKQYQQSANTRQRPQKQNDVQQKNVLDITVVTRRITSMHPGIHGNHENPSA